MISFANAASSPSGLIPLKTSYITGLILSPGGWHATLFSPANSGGGAILDADYPSMKQVDMGYNVTCSRIIPDLTSIIIQ